MNTIPKSIFTRKENVPSSFLQISKASWGKAYRELGGDGLAIYLYFMGNAEYFEKRINIGDIQALGMTRETFLANLNLLVDKGYLVESDEPDVYYIYDVPPKRPEKAIPENVPNQFYF